MSNGRTLEDKEVIRLPSLLLGMSALLLSIVAIGASAPANPPQCLEEFQAPYFRWKQLPVAVYTAHEIPNHFHRATKSAVDKWNSALKTPFFVFKGSSKECAKSSVTCVLLDDHASYLKISGKDDYAYTRQEFKDGYWTSADIHINPALNWKHPAKVGQVDPYSVILHELGHLLGLQHHFFHLNSIMNYLPYEAGVAHLSISDFDVEVIQWLYLNGTCPASDLMAFVDGNNAAAMKYLKRSHPNLSDISDLNRLYLLSRLERSEGRLGEALKVIDRAIGLATDRPVIVRAYLLNHRADLHFQLKDNARALKDFEESMRLAPGNYQTITYVALLKHLMGQPGSVVLELLQKALTIKPTFGLALELKQKIQTGKAP